MPFTWEGRYILRRTNETDPDNHRVYKHSDAADRITSADNYFSGQPALASKRRFDAFRMDPPLPWAVTLADLPSVEMAVFVLRNRA